MPGKSKGAGFEFSTSQIKIAIIANNYTTGPLHVICLPPGHQKSAH